MPVETRDDIINVIVTRGVGNARRMLTDDTLSVGGVLRKKTQTHQREERVRLTQVAEILDLLRWYGEWGTTAHGIEMELIRRAKETK